MVADIAALLLQKQVVVGENQTFMGEEELLRSRGVEVVVSTGIADVLVLVQV